MNRLVVVGDLNLDVCIRGAAPIVAGDERREVVRAEPGGSAATFARVASSHGASVTFIGSVGTDGVGDLLIRSLQDAGVRPLVRRVGMRSGVVVSMQRDRERSMICSRGANDGLSVDDAARAALCGARHLHASGYAFLSPRQRPHVLELLALARQQGLSISVDPPPANLIRSFGREEFLVAIADASWIFPNRSEGMLLTGERDPETVVEWLVERFPVGALTLGAQGALAWKERARSRLHESSALDVDSTGAGDAYAAGFCVTLLDDGDLARANAVGCAAAREHMLRRPLSA